MTTHLNLAQRLRKSGATSLLPLLTFMVWIGTTVLLFYPMVVYLVLYTAVHYSQEFKKGKNRWQKYYIFPYQNIFLLIFMQINL